MTYSEEVLSLFLNSYVIPARQRGQAKLEVRAGEIHSRLGWTRRVPLVCAALSSKKLQQKVGVRLTEKDGPPSGQSSTVVFRYELMDEKSPRVGEVNPVTRKRGLLSAYGAAAHLYRQVGGGDTFLKAEREGFDSIATALVSPEEQPRKNGSGEE